MITGKKNTCYISYLVFLITLKPCKKVDNKKAIRKGWQYKGRYKIAANIYLICGGIKRKKDGKKYRPLILI